MAFELRGFLTGIALELSVNPLFLNTGKKIVAYSYNGVVLPKLPEWDKSVYPYAVIWYDATTGDNLLLFSTAQFNYNNFLYMNALVSTADGSLVVYKADGLAWARDTEKDKNLTKGDTAFTGNGHYPVWSNYDIRYADDYNSAELAGTIYLGSSEPAPVYE